MSNPKYQERIQSTARRRARREELELVLREVLLVTCLLGTMPLAFSDNKQLFGQTDDRREGHRLIDGDN